MRLLVPCGSKGLPLHKLVARLVAIGLVVSACALTAGTARADLITSVLTTVAGGGCPAGAPMFPDDSRSYYFASDGGFESGGIGWTFAGGGKVVPGNETFYVHSSSDRRSALLPAGASVTSPQLCFGLFYPGVRFFVSSPTGSATVHVRLIARGLFGVLSVLDGGTAQVGSTWSATPAFSTLFSQLNVPVGTKTIQLVVSASDGAVQLDDVGVDPFLQW